MISYTQNQILWVEFNNTDSYLKNKKHLNFHGLLP